MAQRLDSMYKYISYKAEKPVYIHKQETEKNKAVNIDLSRLVILGGTFEKIGGNDESVGGGNQKMG